MAAFQSRAAANNICYRAESMRYLGTATFMLKENMHFEELQKPNPAEATKIKRKEKYTGEA